MKNLIVFILFISGFYYIYPKSKSLNDIAKELYFDNGAIVYDGNNYESNWTKDTIRIKGTVRLIDYIYDKNMPILTTKIAISSGDFSDPEKIEIKSGSNGFGIYQIGENQNLNGNLAIYNIIPDGAEVQSALELVQNGDIISLLVKASTSGSLKSGTMQLKLQSYQPNKYVNNRLEKSDNSQVSQYIVFVSKVL